MGAGDPGLAGVAPGCAYTIDPMSKALKRGLALRANPLYPSRCPYENSIMFPSGSCSPQK
jgi:hypothetical protein